MIRERIFRTSPRYKGHIHFKLKRRRGDNAWCVVRTRTWDEEWIEIPDDEAEWVTNWQRARELFYWHRNHGLARQEPHPMGKDLAHLRSIWGLDYSLYAMKQRNPNG